jgi:hypothetical protein
VGSNQLSAVSLLLLAYRVSLIGVVFAKQPANSTEIHLPEGIDDISLALEVAACSVGLAPVSNSSIHPLTLFLHANHLNL